MFSLETFHSLLERLEDETLDFKESGYSLDADLSKAKFIKDVIAMANTPRDSSSYIVLGVRKHKDGRSQLCGIAEHEDDAILRSHFGDKVTPLPTFHYHRLPLNGREFGVIEIPPVRVGPCYVQHDYPSGNASGGLRARQIYFRRGSTNDVATPDDSRRILEWFKSGISNDSEPPGPAWPRFKEEVADFASGRYFVLVASPGMGATIREAPLGLPPWIAVIDFDPTSDENGLLAACKGVLESRRSLHLVVGRQQPALNIRAGTYWYFARGLDGGGQTDPGISWLEWKRAFGGPLRDQMQRIAKECAPHPVTCVVLWADSTLIRHLQSTLEWATDFFSDIVNVVIVTEEIAELRNVADEVGAPLLQIPINQLSSGIATMFDRAERVPDETVVLPSSSDAPVRLEKDTQLWLQEELDIVHIGLGQVKDGEMYGVNFLQGNEVGWADLALHYDADRDISARLKKQLDADLALRKGRPQRINLFHEPGAGGTTVARRMLWDLHQTYPCVILRRTNPMDTVERIATLASETQLPVLILVDGAEVAERQVDELFEFLQSRHLPVAILQVLRRFAVRRETGRSFYLKSELSPSEARKLAFVLRRERPDRAPEIADLLNPAEPRMRSAFYFGLATFREDFRGLSPYVSSRLSDLTDQQRRLIGFLALAHHYGQQPMPAQAFAEFLGLPTRRPVDLRASLPAAAQDLLVEVAPDAWRTAHAVLAKEILEQLLWPPPIDRKRLWSQNLSTWAIDFAELCRGAGPVASEELAEIVRRTFIYRDNAELLGTERSGENRFSHLLEDIPVPEGQASVLVKLTELYPEEAHYWAHLSRFYSIQMRSYIDARRAIDRALDLNEDDSLLHHMKGMALRQRSYQIMEDRGEVDEVLDVAKQASASFAESRDRNPENEHGYISEAQMLARVLDYVGRQHSEGLLRYLASSAADPYLRDCFERAEDLLERVRANREGREPSRYERDCRAKIDALYGRHEDALQIWHNLLTRRDVYQPPVRRQIIWTYLARRDRSWDNLTDQEAHRAMDLLQENLNQEPNSDTNLRLWVQAVRRAPTPPSIERVIEQVSYWKAAADSLESCYYLYVFHALQILEKSTLARDPAYQALEECRAKARFRRNRSKSIEWLGHEHGVRSLVHHSQLGEWDNSLDFWENPQLLERVSGRITKIEGGQAGRISLEGGLEAFFVPSRTGHSRDRSLNQRVTLYLGFSYDGPRAWEVRDA